MTNYYNSAYILAGTGSKSLQTKPTAVKAGAYSKIRTFLMGHSYTFGTDLVIMSGMAEGFDKALAIAAIELELRLWLALPNKGYLKYYWQEHSLTGQNQMLAAQSIMANAEEIIYVIEDVHDLPTSQLYVKGRHANFIRNDYMVDIGNEFLVWDPTSSGTKDCLASIKKVGKPFTILS